MKITPPRPLRATLLVSVLALASFAAPAHALRVVTWNLHAYDNGTIAFRQPALRTVMSNLNADVLLTQEMISQAGVDSFQINVLDVVAPGQWANSGFFLLQTNPTPEGGAIFWRRPAVDTVSFINTLTTGGPRNVLFGRVVPHGYTSIAGTFRVYSVHFKAGGPGTSDSTTRRLEATSLRSQLNSVPANTNFLVGGDTNIYGAYEGAYIRLTESQPDNDGRGTDPLNMPGDWHTIAGYAPFFSQCPCLSCPSGSGYSGGGLDDRFDLLLSSGAMNNGQGVEMLPSGYSAYGNDGQHYNSDVNGGGFNNAVGLTVANALWTASDHLPVIATVQLASRLSVASSLPFGSVIVGAVAQQTLNVANGGAAPVDALDYSLAAPSGFTAPGGSFSAAAGASNDHTVSMSTASVGAKSGNLVVTSDDPDNATRNVALSGTVLAHAIPSLDSTVTVIQDSLRFGIHEAGGFADQGFRVHDRGWSALQAQLAVNGAAITGGAGRFTIVGGFTPVLLAGTGRTWNLHFDDTGATTDSLYEATLTVTDADEALPGGTAQSPLVLHLVATVAGASNAVPPSGVPTTLDFLPPRPNPVSNETRFAFDLPRGSRATLDVFDLGGRRVARVVDAELPAGRHEVRWAARDDSGRRLAGGLYFARFTTRGYSRTQRLAILP
jgi:endonuclease/exonuclease/phosphatase family metal-dependent hydrolase